MFSHYFVLRFRNTKYFTGQFKCLLALEKKVTYSSELFV